MVVIKAIIDFLMVFLLIRLLIRPNEAYFDPIFRLIYRITDPVLIPAGYVTRNPNLRILLSLLAMVILRGLVYLGAGSVPLVSGVGISFLNLFQLLFQAYMVMWFVSILSRQAFGTSFLNLIQRAFLPLYAVSRRFGIGKKHFYLFTFLFLWILYGLLATIIRFSMAPQGSAHPFNPIYGLVEGLMLVIGLFPFPGFFSLMIVAGAILSWVSPDPSNPIVQAIYGISEPLLIPFRRFIPLLGGIDVSPIVALVCFNLLGALAGQVIEGLLRGIL